jgi:hypothetical protein
MKIGQLDLVRAQRWLLTGENVSWLYLVKSLKIADEERSMELSGG